MKLPFSSSPDGAEAPNVLAHRQSGAKAAICFIHGFGGDIQRTWGRFPDILLDEPKLQAWDLLSMGYSTGLSFDITGVWKAAAPLDKLAGLLRTVSSMGGLEEYESIAFVAHSMGGLSVQRALVDDHDLAERVGHVVLFGTPSGGLRKASFFRRWMRQIRDMSVDSPFITDLRKRWLNTFGNDPPFRFLAVAGSEDEFVPANSALEAFPESQRAIVFGDHLSIVKPTDAGSLCVQVVVNHLVDDAAAAGPWNSARVAVEMRDFRKAVDELEGHKDELDDKHLVYLALAYDELGRRDDAIELLQNAGSTDAMGVLAGRHKRLWKAGGRKSDGDKALELYREAYRLSVDRDVSQAFYHAINVAYMELEYRRDESAAQSYASLALYHATSAPQDKWSLATQGEAHLLQGEDEAALVRYRQALAQSPTPREMSSMHTQATRVAELLNRKDVVERLDRLFRPS
ncbi:MAG: tetratricopeptide repeat protein [bacterium]|nr:tetratricopeptide repeat protein [bacterium]